MAPYSRAGGTLGIIAPHYEVIQSAPFAVCSLHQVSWVLVALPWSSSVLMVFLIEAVAASREVLLKLREIRIILHLLL